MGVNNYHDDKNLKLVFSGGKYKGASMGGKQAQVFV